MCESVRAELARPSGGGQGLRCAELRARGGGVQNPGDSCDGAELSSPGVPLYMLLRHTADGASSRGCKAVSMGAAGGSAGLLSVRDVKICAPEAVAAGRLYTDHIRAPVGQDTAGGRARDDGSQLEHTGSLQRAHGGEGCWHPPAERREVQAGKNGRLI